MYSAYGSMAQRLSSQFISERSGFDSPLRQKIIIVNKLNVFWLSLVDDVVNDLFKCCIVQKTPGIKTRTVMLPWVS